MNFAVKRINNKQIFRQKESKPNQPAQTCFLVSLDQPFKESIGNNFKPNLWYRTRSRHGRTLLMLSFHYDVLSMNILTIGVTEMSVGLQDRPYGCFGNLDPEDKMMILRKLLFSRENAVTRSSYRKSAREEYVCNQVSTHVTNWLPL